MKLICNFFLTANTNMIIICKEYSWIYSNIRYTLLKYCVTSILKSPFVLKRIWTSNVKVYNLKWEVTLFMLAFITWFQFLYDQDILNFKEDTDFVKKNKIYITFFNVSFSWSTGYKLKWKQRDKFVQYIFLTFMV